MILIRDERDDSFTLPDTETSTEIETDTDNDKLAQNPIGIYVGSMNTST